ncbi:hypothetical protein D3C74_481790 [compost metagenome]
MLKRDGGGNVVQLGTTAKTVLYESQAAFDADLSLDSAAWTAGIVVVSAVSTPVVWRGAWTITPISEERTRAA